MEKKPVNLCKVTLTVSRIPKEVVFDVRRAIGIEKTCTYLLTAMEGADEPKTIQTLEKPKVITKRNLIQVNPRFDHSDNICNTWCLEENLEKAKEACMKEMECMGEKGIEWAIRMKETFQEYKSKLKK